MFRVTSFLCILLYSYSPTVSDEIKSSLLPDRNVCGIQEEQRIYGGKEANIGEFPWVVLLKSGRYDTFICGGTLINTRYVLTAAHCVPANADIASVRLGEHNVKSDQDCEGDTPGLDYCSDPPIDVEVEEIIPREGFSLRSENLYEDIALLRLKKEVNYTDFIKPICLPLSSELRYKAFSGERATVAGWGKTKESAKMSDMKLKVEIPVVSNHDCAEFYKKHNGRIAASQICAGGEKWQDSCQGDSGGPLMYRYRSKDEENWVIIGVVSYGASKCGAEGEPGVYTRVTEYLDWINDNIKP
ncbi:hypothetical protein ILUMI_22350 [Ignelater luminosus]|uniref:Peptidase S1 domain-containing protein n=1 Tax=Ignelater luminosus TaxID=2038154 RepID=A0A8K0CCX7_IGNLU|nr:hypothetical protein ILUMI_22350 [Ignelater luminosus]